MTRTVWVKRATFALKPNGRHYHAPPNPKGAGTLGQKPSAGAERSLLSEPGHNGQAVSDERCAFVHRVTKHNPRPRICGKPQEAVCHHINHPVFKRHAFVAPKEAEP